MSDLVLDCGADRLAPGCGRCGRCLSTARFEPVGKSIPIAPTHTLPSGFSLYGELPRDRGREVDRLLHVLGIR